MSNMLGHRQSRPSPTGFPAYCRTNLLSLNLRAPRTLEIAERTCQVHRGWVNLLICIHALGNKDNKNGIELSSSKQI